MKTLNDVITASIVADPEGDLYPRRELIVKGVKELLMALIDTTEILGPAHPQTTLYKSSLKRKVREL